MKKILKPAPVPWKLSVSGSDVQVHVDEERGCTITFWARFALEETSPVETIHKRVRLQFSDFPEVRIYRPSESMTFELDYSRVFVVDRNRPRDEENARLMKIWSTTGSCPSPGIYEIVNSELISDPRDGKHLMILGNEVVVELLTLCYKWSKVD
jgi:hypothetical protein